MNSLKTLFLPKRNNLFDAKLTSLKIDRIFLIYTIILAVMGSIMVFSAGYAYAEFRYDDRYFFVKRQIPMTVYVQSLPQWV